MTRAGRSAGAGPTHPSSCSPRPRFVDPTHGVGRAGDRRSWGNLASLCRPCPAGEARDGLRPGNPLWVDFTRIFWLHTPTASRRAPRKTSRFASAPRASAPSGRRRIRLRPGRRAGAGARDPIGTAGGAQRFRICFRPRARASQSAASAQGWARRRSDSRSDQPILAERRRSAQGEGSGAEVGKRAPVVPRRSRSPQPPAYSRVGTSPSRSRKSANRRPCTRLPSTVMWRAPTKRRGSSGISAAKS